MCVKGLEEIRDPRYAKVGDLILWPAETGKTLHIHGSVSTMRKLGFSVGRRWNAISYDQVKLLQADPARPRFLFVSTVSESRNGGSSDDADLSINRPSGTPVREVTVMELPLVDLKNGEFDDRAGTLSCSESFMKPVFDDIGLANSAAFYGAKTDVFLDMAVSASEEYAWADDRHVKNVEEYDRSRIERAGVNTSGFMRPDDPASISSVRGMISEACTRPDGYGFGQCTRTIEIPAMVLVNASRYGLKVYRPDAKTSKAIASRYASYYMSMIEKRYMLMYERVKSVYRMFMAENHTLKERADLFGAGSRKREKAVGRIIKEVCNGLER